MRRLALAALVTSLLVGISLTAAGALAQNDTNQTHEAPDEEAPASFEVTCNQLQCSFDDSAASLDNTTIETYTWDLGDGATATGATAEHTYTDVGTYTVTLTLEGADGTTRNETRELEVTADRHGNDDTVPWAALGVGGIALVASVVIARMT